MKISPVLDLHPGEMPLLVGCIAHNKTAVSTTAQEKRLCLGGLSQGQGLWSSPLGTGQECSEMLTQSEFYSTFFSQNMSLPAAKSGEAAGQGPARELVAAQVTQLRASAHSLPQARVPLGGGGGDARRDVH